MPLKSRRNFADNQSRPTKARRFFVLIIIRRTMKSGRNIADNHTEAYEIWEELS
jgi:hypothetical protein